MLINFYNNKKYFNTVNFDRATAMCYHVNKVKLFFENTYSESDDVKDSKSLAEEISIYAALGEKLICVNISDEYELGYKIIPLSDFSFAREREKA